MKALERYTSAFDDYKGAFLLKTIVRDLSEVTQEVTHLYLSGGQAVVLVLRDLRDLRDFIK